MGTKTKDVTKGAKLCPPAGIIRKIIYLTAGLIILISVLNIPVITKQGIEGRVIKKTIPLYLKTLGFVYRHFEYKQLVRDIIEGKKSDKEKVLAIFDWTHKNILKVPKNYPVSDDHILNIVIRGYGSSDQSNDVFCNLCNYAGIKATWLMMRAKNSRLRLPVSFVKIDNNWRIFDTYQNLYFLNEKNEIASLDDLIRNPDIIRSQTKDIFIRDIPYANFLEDLKTIDKIDNQRFRQQTPLGRIAEIFGSERKTGNEIKE